MRLVPARAVGPFDHRFEARGVDHDQLARSLAGPASAVDVAILHIRVAQPSAVEQLTHE